MREEVKFGVWLADQHMAVGPEVREFALLAWEARAALPVPKTTHVIVIEEAAQDTSHFDDRVALVMQEMFRWIIAQGVSIHVESPISVMHDKEFESGSFIKRTRFRGFLLDDGKGETVRMESSPTIILPGV